jgi:uncharacterized membrane protein YfcA
MALVYVAVAIFIAFVVRGFSGFGSSLIAVSALTLVLAPALVVGRGDWTAARISRLQRFSERFSYL